MIQIFLAHGRDGSDQPKVVQERLRETETSFEFKGTFWRLVIEGGKFKKTSFFTHMVKRILSGSAKSQDTRRAAERTNGPVWGRRVDGGGRGGDRWTSVQYRADRRPEDTLQVIVVCKTWVDRVVLQVGSGGGQGLTSGEWGRLLSWGGVVWGEHHGLHHTYCKSKLIFL